MADKSWLSSLLGSRSERRFELVVLEGAQAGQRFPLRHQKMLIGRRAPDPSRPREICLSDQSVSLRQATLEIKRGRVFIEHLAGATNPTVVNRRRVTRRKLRSGDILVLGLVVLELREIVEARRPEPRLADSELAATPAAVGESSREHPARAAAAPAGVSQAESETWLEREPEAEAREAPTVAWSPPATSATPAPQDPGENPTQLDVGDLPEDEMATIVRPPPETAPRAPGPRAETRIAESTDAEPEPKAGENPTDLDAGSLPEDERATVVRPPPETAAPAPGPQDETVITEPTNDESKS
jgi:pSer/pThr/pTyr-binding forkhead associated (FHA) protein